MPEKSTALTPRRGIAMDDERKSVTLDGEEVTLTPTEYGILRLSCSENPAMVFSSADIYRRVWKDEPFSAEGRCRCTSAICVKSWKLTRRTPAI